MRGVVQGDVERPRRPLLASMTGRVSPRPEKKVDRATVRMLNTPAQAEDAEIVSLQGLHGGGVSGGGEDALGGQGRPGAVSAPKARASHSPLPQGRAQALVAFGARVLGHEHVHVADECPRRRPMSVKLVMLPESDAARASRE